MQIVINTRQDRDNAKKAIDAIRSDPKMQVTIEEYKDDRSAAQNRLMWMWLTDCQRTTVNEQAGKTKKEWHHFFKEHSLLNLYVRQDRCGLAKGKMEGIAETMDRIYDVKVSMGNDTFESMKKFVVEKGISTTWADVELFAEYLNDIQRFCSSVGISLRTDSQDFKRAMGIK